MLDVNIYTFHVISVNRKHKATEHSQL